MEGVSLLRVDCFTVCHHNSYCARVYLWEEHQVVWYLVVLLRQNDRLVYGKHVSVGETTKKLTFVKQINGLQQKHKSLQYILITFFFRSSI